MTPFTLYVRTGLEHIADLNAYDHILFVVALCAVYDWRAWKSVLILVTAFTLGHSVTLALATLDWITFSSSLIELLIPISIILTCIYNLASRRDAATFDRYKYLIALGFGLIHGMGFSNFLKELLGSSGDILMPLFAFNIGIELGQLIIVVIALSVAYIAMRYLKVSRWHWNLIVSCGTLLIALKLLIDLLS